MDKLIGTRFGRLIVIEMKGKKGYEKIYTCRCDCGQTKDVYRSNLMQGRTTSCGCLWKESIRKGVHQGRRTRLYRIWTNMKTRCYNPRSPGYNDYGGRGIRICDEWRYDFAAFRDWALANGYSDRLSIERIDYNGNYEPNNCKWVGLEMQSKNRRGNRFITICGETRTLKEWCRALGLNYKTVHSRISRGMDEKEALFWDVAN